MPVNRAAKRQRTLPQMMGQGLNPMMMNPMMMNPVSVAGGMAPMMMVGCNGLMGGMNGMMGGGVNEWNDGLRCAWNDGWNGAPSCHAPGYVGWRS